MQPIEESLLKLSIFPWITNSLNKVQDGQRTKRSKECTSCVELFCKTRGNNSVIQKCPKGINFSRFYIRGKLVVLNSFIVESDFRRLPRKRKKELQDRVFNEQQIKDYFQEWIDSFDRIDQAIEEEVKLQMSSFHDIKTAISSVFRSAEHLVKSEEGRSFDEKIENSDPKVRSLYIAVKILEERLKLMPLISNPEFAKSGRKRPTPVYKIIDKYVRLFYTTAYKKSCRISLSGTSYNKHSLYESFGTIPMILIDNAIKYSMEDQTIDVRITASGNRSTVIEIESFSPYISSENRVKIFEKGFRPEYATAVASEGSGLGLFIANIVAKAHGITIRCIPGEIVIMKDGIPYGKNIFQFEVS